MKNRLHQESYARSCQKIEELKRRCNQEENTKKTTKNGRISCAAWSGITNSESILLRSSLTEQFWQNHVPHQALITSSSRKPTLEVGMLRNTRVNTSNSWKRFWSSTCSTGSWWIIQLFKKFGNTMRNRWWFQGFWEKKSLTKVGAKNHCNQLGLVQEETLAVFYTGMPRETVRTTRNEVGTQEILTWSKHTLQYRKWRNRLTKKAWTVWRPVLWLKLKNPLSIANKMKDIVMWLSTSFRVSWLQAWKQMHLWLSLPLLTSWWWEQLQRGKRRRRYSRSSSNSEEKKRPR